MSPAAHRPTGRRRRWAVLVFALALAAALSAAVLASASAFEFKAAQYPVTVKGASSNFHGLEFAGGVVVCKKATLNTGEGGAPNPTGPSEVLIVHPVYTECQLEFGEGHDIPKVKTEGCNYRFHAAKPATQTGSLDVVCEAGKEILIESAVITGCVIKLPSQSGIKTIEYKNEPAGKVTTAVEASGIKYADTTTCGLVIKEAENAVYREGEFFASGELPRLAPPGHPAKVMFEGLNEAKAPDALEVTMSSTPPTVETCVPTVTQTTAKLCGKVNPNGTEVTECKFEYGPTASYGSSAPCTPSPGSGESPVEVHAEVTGLAPNMTYHFRVSATNSPGTSVSSDQTFKTLPNPPSTETKAATFVTQTTAHLNASVNPNGGAVSECKLEYGTTTSYGASAPCTPSPGSGESPVAVAAGVTGLIPNTEYHFRISATNAGGTSKGADLTFTTQRSLHWYRNGSKLLLGERVGTIGWGTLTLESSAGNVTCRSAQAANIENSGAASQETVLMVTWECKAIGGKCAADEARLTARFLPWTATVHEEGAEGSELYREEAAGVELDSECYVGGKLSQSLAFKTGPVLGETGTWTPKWQNGTGAINPSQTVFDTASGHLYAESEGKAIAGTAKGKLRFVGYQDIGLVPLITLEKP